MSATSWKTLRITNQSSTKELCAHAEIADTFLSRLVGLLGRKELPTGSGLWLRPSSGVHTFGMRFPIDIVALNEDLRIVALHRQLRPWKIAGVGKGVHSILELPSGQIDKAALAVGDRLQIAPPLI